MMISEKRFITTFLFFLSLLVNVSCVFASEDTEIYHIVYGVKSLKRLDSESNVSPWLISPTEKSDLDDEGFQEVHIVSSACSFFEINYEVENLSEKPFDLLVRVQAGEFCNVSEYVFWFPTLIKTRIWDGKHYLEGFSRLLFDEQDSAFIVGDLDVQGFGLDADYKPIKGAVSACENINYLSKVDLSRLLKDPNVVKNKGSVCYTKGVYVDSIQ